MNGMKAFAIVGTLLVLLAGCSPSATPISIATEPLPVDTALPTVAATKNGPLVTPTPSLFPLSDPGPYFAGYQEFTLTDESRGGREIQVTLWYPSLKQPNASGYHIKKNAPLDRSGAPYPLILTGPASGEELFSSHLATYGFTMAIIHYPGEYSNWNFQIIDDPRDILFVLDQMAVNPPQELAGMIDADHAGVTGYSAEGYDALAVSGARWNPEHYLSTCENAPAMADPRPQWIIEIFCNLMKMWAEFAVNAGEEITTSSDGLWQSLTDERIRAVAPLAPDGAWAFGERGLAAVEIPVLMICGTEDALPSYLTETVYIYEHLGTPEKYLVSFIGQGHMMTEQQAQVNRMNHFVTAFLGYYLQGRADYAGYFSESFVEQFDDLAWGVYTP